MVTEAGAPLRMGAVGKGLANWEASPYTLGTISTDWKGLDTTSCNPPDSQNTDVEKEHTE